MKAKLLCDLDADPPESQPGGVARTGTVIDHPHAFRLVQMGVAEPADEECQNAHGMTPEQMQRARFAARRTALGIHPDDFEAYANGEMVGYYADGSWIPGPNFVPPEPEETEGGIILP